MTLDCIIPDGPTAFSAVDAPDGFDAWVESVLSTFTFDLNVLTLDLGVTYEANSRTGYHVSSRQVWLEPRLMDTRYGARVIPHEYGHAVDMILLTREDRAELMDAWQVPGSRNLTTWRNVLEPHDKRPREAFASYFGRIVSPDHAFPWSVNNYYHEAGMAAAETVIRRAEERNSPDPDPPGDPMATIIPRPVWRHPGPLGHPMRLPASVLYIHHSVTQAVDGYGTPRQIANIGISRFGRSSYSYVVTPDGTIYELQGTHVGAHTGGHNSSSLALCFAGNYEHDQPTAAQIEAAGWLHRHLVSIGALKPDAPIRGHRDASGASTACPGSNLYAALPQIREAAATEEDDVTPEQIEAVARRTADLIQAEGLSPRTKDDIADRVWKHDVHGAPAENRLHDADVRTAQVRKALDEHRDFEVDEEVEA